MNFSKKLTYLASVLSLAALGTGCEITVTTDFDSDGVNDDVDSCTGTAFGDPVDASGCSTADDDGDGVLNDMDACPLLAGNGADGCDAAPTVGTLDGMWLINGVAASAELCADAGIANVRFNVNTADGVGDGSWTMPCANQRFDSREQTDEPTIEFNVAYTSFWEALDAGGAVVAMTDPLDLVLNNPPQHATVASPDFIVATANIMDVPLYWQVAVGSSEYDTCAAAMLTDPADSITVMAYIAGEATPFSSDVEVACEDTLTFHEDDFPGLAPGSYELDIAATRASDGLKWGTGPTPCGIEYDGGAQITEGCDIDIQP